MLGLRPSTIRALVLEGLFVFCYVLLRDHIDRFGAMPRWLAAGLLAVVVLDSWAVWLKLRAVRHGIDDKSPVLPASLVIMAFMTIIRTAVFVVMALSAWEALAGARMAATGANWLIAAVFLKEVLVFSILVSAKREGVRHGKPPLAPLVFAADVVLVLSAEFVLVLLDQLFNKPSLDLTWNPLLLLVLIGLWSFLFLLFVLPFRVLYSFESLKGSDSGVLYEVVSIFIVLGSMLWFSLYNSDKTAKHLSKAIASRPALTEFSYTRAARIEITAVKEVCELPLVRLTLRLEYPDYLPTCLYSIRGLKSLDVSDNSLTGLQLGPASDVVQLNASGNRLPDLASLGVIGSEHSSALELLDVSHNRIRGVGDNLGDFANLRWLDLSHNPLTTLDIAPGDLPELERLRLVNTGLPDSAIKSLRRLRPELIIEH